MDVNISSLHPESANIIAYLSGSFNELLTRPLIDVNEANAIVVSIKSATDRLLAESLSIDPDCAVLVDAAELDPDAAS